MDKLKLEHIAAYLPYGLKCHNMGNSDDEGMPLVQEIIGLDLDGVLVSFEHEDEHYIFSETLPILRPLSDLIEVIQYDGYSVVPIARLLDIAISMNWSSTSYLSFDHGKNEYWTYLKGNKPSSIFGYNSEHKYFYLHDNNGNKESVKNQKQLFDFLHELHFDIYGLIEKGLAININTLKK